MDSRSKLRLYKDILFAAKSFPSSKRAKIVQEIRSSFRANASMQKPEDIQRELDVALKGLSQLSMYIDLKKDRSTAWAVHLEQTPMPRKES